MKCTIPRVFTLPSSDKVFTFELYEGDTLVQTFTYSVTSYIYSQMNKKSYGELTAMAELARALYRYGESAKGYAKAHK